MKYKNKILLLLTLIFVFSITGCGNKVEKPEKLETSTEESTEKEEITKTEQTEKEENDEGTVILSKLSDIENVSLDETMNDKYIRITLTPDYGYMGFMGVYEMEFYDDNNTLYPIRTTEEIAELICAIEYFKVDTVLYKDVIDDETVYKLINFRFLDFNGNIIDTLNLEEIQNKAVELDIVKKEGQHEEVLTILEIENYQIVGVNKNNICRTIEYDPMEVDVYMLEIGSTYTFNYESIYDIDWEEYDYTLLSTPIMTENLNIDLSKYIKEEHTVPIWEMTQTLEESNIEGTERITLDSYNTTFVYGGEWGIWEKDFFVDTHSSLCKLAELTDGYYKLDLVIKDYEIINARFIDLNGNTIESIQYDNVVKKLEEDNLVFIKEKEGIFTITQDWVNSVYAVDETDELFEFEYNDDFPTYKIIEDKTYKFKYKEIKKIVNGEYEIEYLLDEIILQ